MPGTSTVARTLTAVKNGTDGNRYDSTGGTMDHCLFSHINLLRIGLAIRQISLITAHINAFGIHNYRGLSRKTPLTE